MPIAQRNEPGLLRQGGWTLRRLLVLLLSFFPLYLSAQPTSSPTQPVTVPASRQADRVAIIPIHEPIDKVTAFSVKRRMDLAIQGGAQALLTDDVVIAGNAYGIFASFSNVTPTQLTLSGNAAVRNNIQDGIRGDLISTHNLVLTISGNVVVDSNGGVGVQLTTGEVRMMGGSVSHNQQYGLALSTGVRVFHVRNAFIHNNTLAGIYWSSLAGDADLGTTASPGGNTITVNGTATSNVNLFMDAPFVTAVGNTWNASVQGADAQGMFSGDVLLTGQIVNAGGNFRVNQAGQQLRLSEP